MKHLTRKLRIDGGGIQPWILLRHWRELEPVIRWWIMSIDCGMRFGLGFYQFEKGGRNRREGWINLPIWKVWCWAGSGGWKGSRLPCFLSLGLLLCRGQEIQFRWRRSSRMRAHIRLGHFSVRSLSTPIPLLAMEKPVRLNWAFIYYLRLWIWACFLNCLFFFFGGKESWHKRKIGFIWLNYLWEEWRWVQMRRCRHEDWWWWTVVIKDASPFHLM